jgi:general stress protein 26
MAEQESISRVWDIIEQSGVGMLTTRFGGGLRARPLEPRSNREEGVICFVVDVRGGKDDEIERAPEVCLVLIDHKDKAYLSVSGRAAVMQDEAKARAIWKKTDNVWWPDGPGDPNVRVLRLVPERAELWDGPSNSAVAAFEFAKARVTGEKPNLGENRKMTVEMK